MMLRINDRIDTAASGSLVIVRLLYWLHLHSDFLQPEIWGVLARLCY